MNIDKIIKIGRFIAILALGTLALFGGFKLIDATPNQSNSSLFLESFIIIFVVIITSKFDKIIINWFNKRK